MSVKVTADGGATVTKRLRLRVKRAAALCGAAARPRHRDAAAKRVVALEWDAVENLLVLGIAPVGAADLRGYDTWVAAALPARDHRRRHAPGAEHRADRDAAARPDRRARLPRDAQPVAAAQDRAGARHEPVPGDTGDAQFNAMVERLPRGSPTPSAGAAAASACCADVGHDRARQGAAAARRSRRHPRDDRDAGRHDERAGAAPCSRPTRPPPTSCAGSGCATRWSGSPRATASRPSASRRCARVQSGWLAFVYPPQFSRQVGGDHAPEARTSACRSCAPARAHARRQHVAVRRPALDRSLRRAADGRADASAA